MTPDHLRLQLPPHRDWPREPEALLRALEAEAERAPRDRSLAALVEQALLQATAPAGLPQVIGGVRRERLVRWDAWSTTWEGVRQDTGTPSLARALRPEHRASPGALRALSRDGRALAGLVEAVFSATPWPTLTCPLPGEPLSPRPTPLDQTRALATSLIALGSWSEAGLGLEPLGASSLRCEGAAVRLIALNPAPPGEDGSALRAAASALLGDLPHASDRPPFPLLRQLAEVGATSLEGAAASLRGAMLSELSGELHQLTLAWQALVEGDRAGRLQEAILRLAWAVPPPEGRGALGVDMEGQPLVLTGERGGLQWGPEGGPAEDIYHPELGLDPRVARRALRTRGAAPLKPHLQEAVGGDAAFVNHATRWIGARLGLRTLRMLLERRPQL
ncbi:MAG: hypothetical protein JXX28_16765 [Deltaproteobacteria bacterium]|nr:hypothetical protein [Deltaproteobacteria bacterium]